MDPFQAGFICSEERARAEPRALPDPAHRGWSRDGAYRCPQHPPTPEAAVARRRPALPACPARRLPWQRDAVRMAAGGGADALYGWLDTVPLSRPRRNIARDFSDGVLAAEVVKFFFPAMVQLHSYVPASSTPQKLANWGHLNRKVLSKLNCCLPQDVIRQLVQCRPGAAEQVLLLLRHRIEERLRQHKDPGVPGALGELSYMETGNSKAGGGCTRESPEAAGARKPPPGHSTVCLQQAEQERALLLAQETIEILQLKVRRLEELLRLKNVRIDDLSRLLREAQQR